MMSIKIPNKLRYLVFNSDVPRMKDFLDGTVCDLFAHILPEAITYVYDELSIRLPLDLEKPTTETSPRKTFDVVLPEKPKAALSSAALAELERKRLEKKKNNKGMERKRAKSPSECGYRELAIRAAKIEQRIAEQKKRAAEEKKRRRELKKARAERHVLGSSNGNDGEDLGEVVVPATPESHMGSTSSDSSDDGGFGEDIDEVMQTPIEKLNRIPKPRDMELRALAEKCFNESLARRGARQPAASWTGQQFQRPTVRVANSPPKSSARVNLFERFAMMDRMKKPKQLEAYDRGTSRRSLFDDGSSKECRAEGTTRSFRYIQRNRCRRPVRAGSGHTSHMLLNIYNSHLLNPPVLPKQCAVKRRASGPDGEHQVTKMNVYETFKLKPFRPRTTSENAGLSSVTIVPESREVSSFSQDVRTTECAVLSESSESMSTKRSDEKPTEKKSKLSLRSGNSSSSDLFSATGSQGSFSKSSESVESSDTESGASDELPGKNSGKAGGVKKKSGKKSVLPGGKSRLPTTVGTQADVLEQSPNEYET
ncbi:unnamed protein product [Gongylonema pulchrum]|uniref:INCENP_ARK-bind domain-containing protein n=1 Tax=Gongylonema pulchrum TaxID=637853 RepID=A0A183EGQ8_9BILA|nr:unnamed protein product [Gongylonema pulchrum]